nr:aspartate carbamoyltransferase regulatory subunit [Nitrososphaeria archaeon]NIN52155.1 aspartate carbamoyltransferase regulatory subunit [Nitrososphaeria archaeon]NIQ32608.1 aspartate carbamoyltransferase regulatory subunit [Nitrososphaeria archaeon]
MKSVEDKLLVRKIKDGIVIDHIPPGKAFLVLKLLRIDPEARIIIASNMNSTKYGKKDMIKIEGKYLTSKEIDLISLVALTATINRIENWEIIKKRKVEIPDVIEGIFKCPNPPCITNSEYEPVKTRFKVRKSDDFSDTTLQCIYCDSLLYHGAVVEFLETKSIPVGGLVSVEKIEKVFLDVLIRKGSFKVAKNKNELFILKSERQSPYFINFGALTDGEALAKIKWAFASYIALLLEERKLDDFDFVFGPAYKGINLATLTCEGLNELFGMEKRYLYDRKEIKNYGDVEVDKVIVGAQHFNSDQGILIVDDIITTGGTILETIEKIRLLGPSKIVGLVLAVDRQEKTGDAMKVEDKSAVDYVREQFN